MKKEDVETAETGQTQNPPKRGEARHPLIAWQRADDLFIKLHQLTIKQFPAFSASS